MFNYLATETTKTLFKSVTIKNSKTGEELTIHIASIDQREYIQWNLEDNSRVFNTTKANYYTYNIGHPIVFHRRSQPEYEDRWEIISFDSESRDRKEKSYIYY